MNTAPIIMVPGRQGQVRRLTFGVLTALAWLVWLSLWTPLWDVVVWANGGHAPPGWGHVTLTHTEWLGVIPVVCGALLAGWAIYNYRRFAHATRRCNHGLPVNVHEAAQVLGTPPEVGDALVQYRRLVVHFDHHHGHPLSADGRDPLP